MVGPVGLSMSEYCNDPLAGECERSDRGDHWEPWDRTLDARIEVISGLDGRLPGEGGGVEDVTFYYYDDVTEPASEITYRATIRVASASAGRTGGLYDAVRMNDSSSSLSLDSFVWVPGQTNRATASVVVVESEDHTTVTDEDLVLTMKLRPTEGATAITPQRIYVHLGYAAGASLGGLMPDAGRVWVNFEGAVTSFTAQSVPVA